MIPSRERLNELVGALARVRLLVVGDIVADEYLLGRPALLGPAPLLPLAG
jgi:bifunctional ADP-heptose synthase (sugar kinase/adenylyltransferase)